MNQYPTIVTFIQTHRIRHYQANVRPWGAYDLVLHHDEDPVHMNTGRTFGWGFSSENAAAIMLFDMASPLTPDGNFLVWLGEQRATELIGLIENIKHDNEKEKENNAEHTTGIIDGTAITGGE